MYLVLFISIVHVFILNKLIFFPYPELFVYPYLAKIGLIPYKDIFDQHFPGIMFFPVNLATLGIDTPLEMRFISYFLIVVSHVLLFLIGRLLFGKNKYPMFINVMYLLWQPYFEGYVLWIESFITPFLLASLYFTLKFRKSLSTKFIFLSGFCLGISLIFKQVVLPLIVIYLITIWVKYRKVKYVEYLTMGLSLPIFYLIYFVLNKKILSDFVYWTITFNLTFFAQMGRKYFSLGESIKTLPVFGFALVSIIYIFIKNKKVFSNDVMFVLIYFIGCLFFVYARQDYIHLQPLLAFSVLIIGKFFEAVPNKKGINYLFVFLIMTLLFVAPKYNSLRGSETIFYSDKEYRIAYTVSKYAKSGDTIFSYGSLPHIYQMTNTIPPGKMFVFQFPWFMKVAEKDILKGLEANPPSVIVIDNNAEVAGFNLVDYMSRIKEHVYKYYHSVENVENVEIMVKN